MTSSAEERRAVRSSCRHSRLAARHSLSNHRSERRTRRVTVRDGAIESTMFVISVVYSPRSSSRLTSGAVNTDDLLTEIADWHSRLVKLSVSIVLHGRLVVT